MKTLFLAWQEAATRAWYPIGRLDADLKKSRFQFQYTQGAEMARKRAGLQPLDAFPDFHKVYESRVFSRYSGTAFWLKDEKIFRSTFDNLTSSRTQTRSKF